MKLKTLRKNGSVGLRDYSEEDCKRILDEKNGYVLRCVRSHGVDYGGSRCREETEETYIEIIPERVLVQDGHFCGVCMIVDYDHYNGGGARELREVCLFPGTGTARDGFSFANDDHERWDYTDYSLVERPEDQ